MSPGIRAGAPVADIDEADLAVTPPQHHAAGIPAVAVALSRGIAQAGVVRTAQALSRLNHRGGFDCPGCAWPEPQGRRRPAEFCENGAKAVAEESTLRTVGPDFFAAHPVSELLQRSEFWLGSQGRLTEPMVIREGSDNYEPITWDGAFTLIAEHLRATTPDRAAFYTSGRTSNEAAYLYQLMARSYGTNNLPDCSNMCHESSGTALLRTIGIGKGSVSLADIHRADLILVVGQNPGTNHPRMLSALTEAKAHGAHIVAVNPLPEAGLFSFRDPQTRERAGRRRHRTRRRLPADQAGRRPGAVPGARPPADRRGGRRARVRRRHGLRGRPAPRGMTPTRRPAGRSTGRRSARPPGCRGRTSRHLARRLATSKATIVCWAMGLTQHKHSVPTLQEIVNLLLIRGMIGKPGAGVCPVRGHSNVQGDRTMGIWELMPEWFLAALDAEHGITSPRPPGYDTVGTLNAMAAGDIDVFIGLGGNFVAATPDTEATEAAHRRVGLTVQISTKPNRAHLVHGRVGLILPTLGRSDRDDGHPGGAQFVTVEDSMSVVHSSRGRLAPVSDRLLAEPVIICRLARALLGPEHPVDWEAMAADYDVIRDHVSRVIPGFAELQRAGQDQERVRAAAPAAGLPGASRTASGKAQLTVNELTWPRVPEGRLLLQTMRSHDQYNTTIYGLDDRYRGISQARRVVLVSPTDITALGLVDRQLVDVISEWPTAAGVQATPGQQLPGGRPTPPPRAAPPPTTRRPTC